MLHGVRIGCLFFVLVLGVLIVFRQGRATSQLHVPWSKGVLVGRTWVFRVKNGTYTLGDIPDTLPTFPARGLSKLARKQLEDLAKRRRGFEFKLSQADGQPAQPGQIVQQQQPGVVVVPQQGVVVGVPQPAQQQPPPPSILTGIH